MDILTNYRNKIESLSEELIHCIEQYNIILKEEKQKETSWQFKKEKRRKSPQKEPSP